LLVLELGIGHREKDSDEKEGKEITMRPEKDHDGSQKVGRKCQVFAVLLSPEA